MLPFLAEEVEAHRPPALATAGTLQRGWRPAPREWLQPVLSHSRSMLNEPTAKYRPLGAHATDEIENSTAADAYSCRP